MHKWFLVLIICSIRLFSYPFTIPYFDEEFFLYPFLNYDHSVEWKKAREGKLYNGNIIQLSYGSLTTYSLMNNEEVVINTDIGGDFLFRFRYRNHKTRHLSYIENSIRMGLGYKLNNSIKFYCETELSYEKEAIDIKPGVLFSSQKVYAYFGVNFNDILLDIKSLEDCDMNKTPITLSYDLRFSLNRLYFFISGNYCTGPNKSWNEEDTGPYTDMLMHRNYIRNFYARLEFDLTDYLKIYSENYWDDFYDEIEYKDSLLEISEYKFSAKLNENKLGAIYSLNSSNIIDFGIGIANTKHNFDILSGSANSYTVDYTALLPFILYDYKIHEKFTIQGGFMASYTVGNVESFHSEDFWDKELLKLGFEYRFSPNASLYISAGQLINTGVFGGGNARFNLFF